MAQPLLAVHISDGILVWPWLAAGFVVSALLLYWSSLRMTDAEIPRIGMLTAVFFVAALIHVRVGPTSVHLLLNGLLGLMLGKRAVLAVAVGLVLQAFLLQHGGYLSLGVNIVIVALPALLARPICAIAAREQTTQSFRLRDGLLAVAYILHPQLFFVLFFSTYVIVQFGSHQRRDVDFYAGFVAGGMCVLLTAFFNAVVLVVAGAEDWRIIAILVLAAHIPVAFIEGFIVGAAVRFLGRVRPDLLGRSS